MRSPGGMAWLVVGLAVTAGVGCSSSTEPGIQPQITNATDNFQYQVSNVQNFTGTQNYNWQHTGTKADVNQATTVTAGSMVLIIKDAAGVEVYNQSLAVNGTVETGVGTAGMWSIKVVYSDASGTVNFRVQKHP